MKVKDFNKKYVNCVLRITSANEDGYVVDIYDGKKERDIPKYLLNKKIIYMTVCEHDGCLVLEVQ